MLAASKMALWKHQQPKICCYGKAGISKNAKHQQPKKMALLECRQPQKWGLVTQKA
jgi:hypothetical protein